MDLRFGLLLGVVLLGCATEVPPPPTPPGELVSVLASRASDPRLDASLESADQFRPEDPLAILVTLKDFPVGTRCEVVIYRNGKYFDLRGRFTKRPGLHTETFVWGPNGASRVPGLYRARVFLNGRFTGEVSFRVD